MSNTTFGLTGFDATPTYLYQITCVELGMFYIGIRTAFPYDDPYMGSSEYLNALRAEFNEYEFTKTVMAEYSSVESAKAIETQLILEARAKNPEGLLNRSANDGLNVWEHTGYGVLPVQLHSRLDRVRAELRPILVTDNEYKNLVLVKTSKGAHAPGMPDRDLTPKPQYGTWSARMMRVYASLKPGSYHFACVSVLKNGKKNYHPYALVESFADESEAREMSSMYSSLSHDDYKSVLEVFLSEGESE